MTSTFSVITMAAITGTILALVVHRVSTRRRGARQASASSAARFSAWEKLVYVAVVAAAAVLGATAFIPALGWNAPLRGYLLMIHTVTGAVFAVALTAMAFTWAEECRLGRAAPPARVRIDPRQKVLFWATLALGLTLLTTMLLSMLPLFGACGMGVLLEVHRYSAVLMLVVVLVHFYLRGAAKGDADER